MNIKKGDRVRIKDTENIRSWYPQYIGEEFIIDYDEKDEEDFQEFLKGKTSTAICDKKNTYCINYLLGDLELVKAAKTTSRKEYPIFNGLLKYFPDACLYVAHVSKVANDQHNPGEPMHWAKEKSIGSGDELVRHLMDKEVFDTDGLRHRGKAAWRALELLQREIENE